MTITNIWKEAVNGIVLPVLRQAYSREDDTPVDTKLMRLVIRTKPMKWSQTYLMKGLGSTTLSSVKLSHQSFSIALVSSA